jgi:hypothetical protein
MLVLNPNPGHERAATVIRMTNDNRKRPLMKKATAGKRSPRWGVLERRFYETRHMISAFAGSHQRLNPLDPAALYSAPGLTRDDASPG